nr:hypothetical protein [Tanacetum cinerariifolium]
MGKRLTVPTDPHHTSTILQPSSSQPQKTHKPRKPKRKDTLVPQPSDPTEYVTDVAVHKELVDRLVRVATTASSLEAKHDSGNITKTQSKATLNESSSQGTNSGGCPRCQETMRDTTAQTRFESVSKHSNDSLLARGNTLQSDEDRLKLEELMALQTRVLDLEKTKTSQHKEIASLKRRVKKLEKRNRSRTHKLKRLYKVGLTDRVESSGDEEKMFDVNVLDGEEVFVKQEVSRQNENVVKEVIDEVTLAQALEELRNRKPKDKGLVIQEPGESTTTTTISSKQSHDNGYTLKQLKLFEFDKIQEMFDKAFKRANAFEDFRTELVQEKEKRAGKELVQESTKKQKVEDEKETTVLKQLMEIIPDKEEVANDAIPLAVKSPRIVDWKIHKKKLLSNNHLEFVKSNMRLKIDIKPKEATFQVVLDVLALTPFYQAFLITTEVPANYLQEFWATSTFEDLPLEQDILSFIRDLGHSEDIIYLTDIENKETKKTNKMLYMRFTKVIIDYFMSREQSISRSNKMFWHTAQDDTMFTTMRCISRHEKTQAYGAILPQQLTNQAMLESEAYKTYYAYAYGEKTPKPNWLPKKSKKDFHMSHASGSSDEVDIQSKNDEESWTFSQDEDDVNEDTYVNDDSEETESDNDGDDLTHPNLSTYKAYDEEEEEKADDEEVSSDQRVSTPPEYELTEEEEENKEGDDEDIKGEQEQDEENDMYRDVNINLERSDAEMTNAQPNQDTEYTHDTCIDSILNPNIQSETLVNVPVFIAAKTPSSDTTIPQPPIPNVEPLQQTIDERSSRCGCSAIKNKLREEAQVKNQEFINRVDSTMKTIIKEQVQAQVYKIMPKIEKYVTESLEAKVLVRLTNQPQSSYAVAASLSKFKLKKILIDKIEENKSINKSFIQKNLYNALVESYNSKKYIITSYGNVVTLMRGRDDQDKDEDPCKSAYAEEHDQKVNDLEDRTHQEFNTGNDDVTLVREVLDDDESTCKSIVVFKATNDRSDWHNLEGKPYPHDLSKPLPLILNERGHQVIPLDHFINNDLKYLKGGSSSKKYTTSITKMKATDYGSKTLEILWICFQHGKSKDVHSEHMIIAVTSLKIMKYFGYNHLEEIIVRRQDDQLYNFREGYFKRLCRQEIKDMLLLLVQNKLTNLNLVERRNVIQERVEDLQLGVKSYQKKINLKKPDTYRSDLKRMTLYTTYPGIQGIIYEDEMNRNCLMHTDELHKFNDGILNHVCTALNDIATGIEMDYLPKRRWSKQDKQRDHAMISPFDKKLRDRRLMRNLEKFIGGRPYGGDLRLMERTI